MYAGRKVEESTVDALFAAPCHPYTVGLMGSVPRLPEAGVVEDGDRGGPLAEIPGVVPRLDEIAAGCAFAPRCGLATERCRERAPPFEEKAPGQWAACWESHRLAAASHA
jgi:peptide/nickel transport system ATP-binding protein